jgi:hypothetical protein
MNQNLCEIGFALDWSASMQSMAKEAIGGFNGFLESHQKAPGDANLNPRASAYSIVFSASSAGDGSLWTTSSCCWAIAEKLAAAFGGKKINRTTLMREKKIL